MDYPQRMSLNSWNLVFLAGFLIISLLLLPSSLLIEVHHLLFFKDKFYLYLNSIMSFMSKEDKFGWGFPSIFGWLFCISNNRPLSCLLFKSIKERAIPFDILLFTLQIGSCCSSDTM